MKIPRTCRTLLTSSALLLCALPLDLFASEGGKGGFWGEGSILAGKVFNSIVLFGGLAFLLRKPLKDFFVSRTAAIRHQMEEAEASRRVAEEKLQELQKRLANLDQETEAIRAQAQTDAEAERERARRLADEELARMKNRAMLEIESMKKQALSELAAFTAARSAAMAEEILRREVTPDDDEKLFRRFLSNVGDKS